jgi:hypothetical protein
MNNENTYRAFHQQQQGPTTRQPLQPSTRPARITFNSREDQQRQLNAHNDRMQRVQVQFKNLAGQNDFNLVDAVVPLPRNSYNPNVPSNSIPVFDPPEAPAPAPPSDEGAEANNTVIVHEPMQSLAGYAYPQVYRDAPFYQQPQTNLIVNPVPAYLTLDSRDRDRKVWPNTNQYRIPLVASDNDLNVLSPNVRYKNIYSISLLSCVIPRIGGVMFEPYIILQIDEIDRVYDSANTACAKAFTKLYFKEVCPASKFYRLDKGVGDPLTKIYWPAPRASLESITLSFRHPDGTLFDFGPDAPLPDPMIKDLQTTITLEIRTYVTDSGKAIGHRNP